MSTTSTANPMTTATTHDTLPGQWYELRGKLKQKWGKLTEDDLDMIDGKREELIKALQKRYSYDRVKAEAELNTLFKEPQHA